MVQIKKKVTLKAKTEQEPVVEPIQQSTKPTLRKKAPVKEPEHEPTPTPTPTTGGGDGKSGNSKIYGGIAAAVVACLLGYGAYSYFNSSDEKTDDTTTEVVEGTTDTSNEGDGKEQNNDQTVETPETESADASISADREKTASPAQEETSPDVSSAKTEPKQDVTAKTTEPAKPTSQPTSTVQPTTPAVQPATLSGTLEEKAKEVIRGNYGNGEVRKQKLGDQYAEIQSKVNEMYRNGLVK